MVAANCRLGLGLDRCSDNYPFFRLLSAGRLQFRQPDSLPYEFFDRVLGFCLDCRNDNDHEVPGRINYMLAVEGSPPVWYY